MAVDHGSMPRSPATTAHFATTSYATACDVTPYSLALTYWEMLHHPRSLWRHHGGNDSDLGRSSGGHGPTHMADLGSPRSA